MMRNMPRAQLPADEDGEYDEEKAQGPADEDGEYDEKEAQDLNTCR
jgi:hypothetical protein